MVKRTPLARRTPLVSRTTLVARTDLKRVPFVPKRPIVTPAERAARDALRKRSGGICEGCLKCRATDFSHRVNASQGGLWAVVNGLQLCRICHNWLHHNITAARELGWSLQRHQNPAEEPVRLPAHGLVLLRADGSVTRVTSSYHSLSGFDLTLKPDIPDHKEPAA